MRVKFILLLAALGLLSSCASTKVFEDQSSKNITIVVEKEKGSVFNSKEVAVEVWRLQADCETSLLGVVETDASSFKIGVKPGQLTYINFRFFSTGMFSNDNSMTYGTLLTPKKGYSYKLKASYIEGIYNLEIFEMKPGRKSKQIETRHYSECNA